MLQQLEALRTSLGEMQSNMAALGDTQANLRDSLGGQVEKLESRLVGDITKAGSEARHTSQQLENLKSMVAGLESKVGKVDSIATKITSMEKALESVQKKK